MTFNEERNTLIFMARTAQKMKRYEDMIGFIREAVLINSKLSDDDRNLLSLAYKKCIDKRRNTLQFLVAVSDHQRSKGCIEKVRTANSMINKLYNELSTYSYEIVNLVDTNIMKHVETHEEKLFYIKLKADYHRYMSESLPEGERWKISEKANQFYEEAMQIAKSSFPPTNILYINTILNYSVFLHEIMQRKEDALTISEDFIQKLNEIEQSSQEHVPNETKTIIRRIQENINMWRKEEKIL